MKIRRLIAPLLTPLAHLTQAEQMALAILLGLFALGLIVKYYT